MPTKTLTAPSGESYTVDVPEGTSDEKIFTTLQEFLKTPAGVQLAKDKATARLHPAAPRDPMAPSAPLSPSPMPEIHVPPSGATHPSPTLQPQASAATDIVGNDWRSAQARLAQGRQSDPSQDKLEDAGPGTVWPRRSGPAQGDVDALPFGDIADPVSQLAFLLAPHLLPHLQRLIGGKAAVAGVQGAPENFTRRAGSEIPLEDINALKQKFGIPPSSNVQPPASMPVDTPTQPPPRLVEAPRSAPPLPATPPQSSPVQPAGIAAVSPTELKIDPERFQYKILHSTKGTTGSLADLGTYDPYKAGVVQVWHDPVEDATYVVNGHNRIELARRAQAPSVNVQYIDVPTAEEARAVGASTNIAQGQGTAVDAAKYFRDSGLTAEDLQAQGVSLSRNLARDGLALSRLNPSLFGAVTRGEFPVTHGVIIGERVPEAPAQYALMRLLEKAKASGKHLTDGTVAELADMARAAPTHEETALTLFGPETTTTSLAVEKAELSGYIRGRLHHEKALFGRVGKQGAAEELSRAGNVIDVEGSQREAQQAAQLLSIFDRLKNATGPVSDSLNHAAQRIAGGENATKVRQQLYTQLVADFPSLIHGAENAGSAGGTNVLGAAPGDHLPGF